MDGRWVGELCFHLNNVCDRLSVNKLTLIERRVEDWRRDSCRKSGIHTHTRKTDTHTPRRGEGRAAGYSSSRWGEVEAGFVSHQTNTHIPTTHPYNTTPPQLPLCISSWTRLTICMQSICYSRYLTVDMCLWEWEKSRSNKKINCVEIMSESSTHTHTPCLSLQATSCVDTSSKS